MKSWLYPGTSLLLLLLAACSAPPPPAHPLETVATDELMSLQLTPDISLEIDARLEFLAGTQIFNGWADTPYGDSGWFPPAYYKELKALFEPFKDGPEMAVCRNLYERGLRFTGPINLIQASSGGFAFDKPTAPYSDYLLKSADAAENLDAQLAAWRNLAAATNFPAWFSAHQPYYQRLLARLAQDLPADKVSLWLHDWFGGDEALVFHYNASPGMMTAGSGAGSTVIRNENGRAVRHVYQFTLGAESADGKGLASTGLHEFCHSWVNPAIGGQIPESLQPALQLMFDRALLTMGNMPYQQLESWLNETVNRAVTIRGASELGLSRFGAAVRLFYEDWIGFKDIGVVYRILDEYAANRQLYPDFKSFGPMLLQRLVEQSDLDGQK